MPFAWTCPKCEDSVPGPRKPSFRGPVNLCYDCSLGTGLPVFRIQGDKLPRRARRTRPSNGQLVMLLPGNAWKGINLQAECQRLAELEITPSWMGRHVPVVEIRSPTKKTRVAGWAMYQSNRIIINTSPLTSRSSVLATLVHEFAHLFCGPQESHGDYFRMTLVELTREGYSEEPQYPRTQALWHLDASCEIAIARWLQKERPVVSRTGAGPC